MGLLSLESLNEVIREIAGLKGVVSFWNAQLRLDDLLNVRGEVEYKKTEFLGGKILHTIEPQKPPPVIAIDGSSRVIDTAYAFSAIATVSLVSERFGVLLDYPHLWFNYPIVLRSKPPFIGIAPEAPNIKLKLPYYATQRSPAGYLYDVNYNRNQIVDEIRTNLENYVLLDGAVKASLLNIFGLKHRLILIDGPLYHTPAVFISNAERKYKESWKILIRNRVKAIQENLNHGLTVVGIVKRIEKSVIMIRSYDYVSEASKILNVDLSKTCSDLAAIDTIYHYSKKKGLIEAPLKPLIIGPFRINPSWAYINLPKIPEKIVAYTIIPKHPYLDVGYKVFRIEVPLEAYEKYGSIIFEWIVGDAVLTSSALPYSLILADMRCRKWSATLLLYISRLYSEAQIPLTYGSRIEIEHLSKEVSVG